MKINKNVFRMIRYFFRCKKATAAAIIMCCLGLAVGIATPVCNKLIQQDIIPNKNISLFVWLTILILVLNLVSTLSSYFTTRIFINNGVPITANIRKDIIKNNIYNQKHLFDIGKVLATTTTFLEDANAYYISYMYLVFDCTLKFMFYFPFFTYYGGYLSLIMVGAIIVSFAFIAIADIFCRRQMQASRKADAERFDYTLKLLQEMEKPNFEENETYNMQEYMKRVYAFDKTWLGYCNWANTYPYIFNLIWYIGACICFCLTFNMLAAGTLLFSTFIVFNSYLDQVKAPISNFTNYKLMTVRYEETFKKVFDMLDDPDLQK